MSALDRWFRAGAIMGIACWLVAGAPVHADKAKRAAPAKRVAQVAKPRKVAVAAFDAPDDSHARAAVLATLADHDDVEVVGLDDLTFAGQRLKADPETPEGRKRLSEEFGVEMWIDGRVDGDSAELLLSRVDGTKLEATSVQAPTAKLLDALAGERMWQSMGRYLSAREDHRRRLLEESERARAKLEARATEAEREQAVAKANREAEHERAEKARERAHEEAVEAEAAHKKALEAQRTLAEKKLEARKTQLNRELDIALTRKAEELVARENQEAARKAQQQQLAAQNAAAKERAAWAARNGAKPIPGWSTNAGSAPTGRKGVSSATQRWLQQQEAYLPPNNNTSQPRPPYAAASSGGISPATQRWLAQQQEYRQ